MSIRFAAQPAEFQCLIAATPVWQQRAAAGHNKIDRDVLVYDRDGLMFGEWDERFVLVPSDEVFRRGKPLHSRMPAAVHDLRAEFITLGGGYDLVPTFEARLLAMYPRWGEWMGRINGRIPPIDRWAPEYRWTGLNPEGLDRPTV